MKVAVFGASGQLGQEVVRTLSETGAMVVALSRADCDVADPQQTAGLLREHRPDAVINSAAYVRVDDAEEQAEAAFRANAIGALAVARAAEQVGACCVYISTDYVFEGTLGRAYTEDDATGPLNVYGASKLAGEHLTRIAATRHLIVRVAGLFGGMGASSKGGNFIRSILQKATTNQPLRVVDDTRISITYARHAARAVALLLEDGATGVVHVTNRGTTTWHEVATHALKIARLEIPIERASSAQFASRARRPRHSALESLRAGRFREALPPWQVAIEEYLGAILPSFSPR